MSEEYRGQRAISSPKFFVLQAASTNKEYQEIMLCLGEKELVADLPGYHTPMTIKHRENSRSLKIQ